MGDVSRQYLFIGETGSDTGGVGCISAAIVAHVDNQSVTYRQIDVYKRQHHICLNAWFLFCDIDVL